MSQGVNYENIRQSKILFAKVWANQLQLGYWLGLCKSIIFQG